MTEENKRDNGAEKYQAENFSKQMTDTKLQIQGSQKTISKICMEKNYIKTYQIQIEENKRKENIS